MVDAVTTGGTVNESSALLALQRCDLDLIRLRTQLDELPERADILRGRRKIADVEKLLEHGTAAIGAVERVIKGLEDGVATITEKLESEQARLMSGEISDPREMQYVAREMDSLRRQRDKAEFTTLEQLEKRESTQSQVAKIEQALLGLREADEAFVASYRASGGALKAEIDRLTGEHEAIAAHLPGPLRVRYERLVADRHGVAVGLLDGDTCTACHMALPANDVRDLTMGGPIGRCPLCHRILIVHSEDEA